MNRSADGTVMKVVETFRDTGPQRRALLAARLAGAGLLGATAAIHLDLYLTGYRSIPTIGWLFLLQVIAAFALAAAVALSGWWLAAAAGAGFVLSTLAGYLLSIWVGLFGFLEVRTTAGIVAGLIEIAAFALLTGVAVVEARRSGGFAALPAVLRGRLQAGPGAALAVGAVSVLALALFGAAVARAAGPRTAASGGQAAVKIGRVGGATVLVNAKGFTVYWFGPDSAARSNCNGACAVYWPPVKGPVAAGAGVTGRLGTIRRSDGSLQATYNGHPLYTYVGDRAPGQARGNNLRLNGGLWHEVTVSG
jgi:predicted lipoprotein with Yx(FWY)xxD motif